MKISILIINLFLCYHLSAQSDPLAQIEGRLEVWNGGDTTSVYIGKDAGIYSLDTSFAFIPGSSLEFDLQFHNTCVGIMAGAHNTLDFETLEAGAENNSFFGSHAGEVNRLGASNSFFGARSGSQNTTGNENSFFGSSSGVSIKTGLNNSFFGNNSGVNIIDGSRNICLGDNSGPATSIEVSDRLYIDSRRSDNPLIYGEFDKDLLAINGTLRSSRIIENEESIVLGIGAYDSSAFIVQKVTNKEKLLELDQKGNLTIFGALSQGSDINRKEEIIRIDTENILEKISSIPISEWQYKGSSERHIGPMAQDFYAAFGLGKGETTIATVDADGVALAAIQALHDKSKEDTQEIQCLRENVLQLGLENQKLRDRIHAFEIRLLQLEK